MPWVWDESGKPAWEDASTDGMVIPPNPIAARQAGATLDNTMARTGAIGKSNAINAERLAIDKERLRIDREAERAKSEAADPYSRQNLDATIADAMSKLEAISRIGRAHKNSVLPITGFGAQTLAGIGGTGAASANTDIESLIAGGALSEVLRLSAQTGKNPFTPMSNSDVQLIARNRGNLSQASDPATFFANLKNYQRAYTQAYLGGKGMKRLYQLADERGLSPDKVERARRKLLSDSRVTSPQPRKKTNAGGRSSSQGEFLGFED